MVCHGRIQGDIIYLFTVASSISRINIDDLVILYTPSTFVAVGVYYLDFRQVSDEEVKRYLEAKTVGKSRREVKA